MPPEQQEIYISWIRQSLKLEKHCKDPRIYCAYCDMSNHPRFACKHVEKHRNPYKEHRCTLCKGKHAPFLCPRAQVNGGKGQPNWYKQEYKKARSEGRAADYRWGNQLTYDDVDGPASKEQPPQEVPPPQCAAAAMMHGMAPASSLHGGCPPIQENLPYGPPGPLPGMAPMQYDVITPNPDYPIPANLWDLNIPFCARMPSPLSTFIRHFATLCRVHTIQHMVDKVFSSQQSPSRISIAAQHPLRISGSCRSIARSLLMSPRVVVYGQKAFRRISRTSRRKSTNGSMA